MEIFVQRINKTTNVEDLKKESAVIERILFHYPDDHRELSKKRQIIEKRIVEILDKKNPSK